MHAAVDAITPAALTEVGTHIVKLSPGDRHSIAVGWVNRDYALVSCVANDVVAILINISLIANEASIRRNHPRRGLNFPRNRRRVFVFFQRLIYRWRKRGRQLG